MIGQTIALRCRANRRSVRWIPGDFASDECRRCIDVVEDVAGHRIDQRVLLGSQSSAGEDHRDTRYCRLQCQRVAEAGGEDGDVDEVLTGNDGSSNSSVGRPDIEGRLRYNTSQSRAKLFYGVAGNK